MCVCVHLMDFILVVCGCIDVAAHVWLEVGWVWTYILESNGTRIPQLVYVSRLLVLFLLLSTRMCMCIRVYVSIGLVQLNVSGTYTVTVTCFQQQRYLLVLKVHLLFVPLPSRYCMVKEKVCLGEI